MLQTNKLLSIFRFHKTIEDEENIFIPVRVIGFNKWIFEYR